MPSTTRPDSDRADARATSEGVAKAATKATASASTGSSASADQSGSSLPATTLLTRTSSVKPTTSSSSAASLETASSEISDTASPSAASPTPLSTSATSINWGPAITASPLPNAATTTPESASSIPTTASQASDGLSTRARNITISTTTIGGVLVLALLIYALFRRRQGATVSEIVHFRRHYPSTIMLTPTPREPRLTALPIYRESRYSVRSSKHASITSFSKSIKRTAPVPQEVAQNFHHQNPYVRSLWKTAHPPTAPGSPLRQEYSSSAGAHRSNSKLKDFEISEGTLSTTRSQKTKQSSRDTTKSLDISISERPLTEPEVEMPTPPESPNSIQNPQDRWSWTNSQAPPTPRMYAPSLRSSISSLPRFRNIRSWVRSQAERNPEEERPVTAPQPVKKKQTLKNKALRPTLAPPATRKLSKKHGRVGSLSSIFMQHPGTLVPSPLSPQLEEQRSVTVPGPAALEMRQLSR